MTCLYSAVDLEIFLQFLLQQMESLPLNPMVLDFGLQRPTGPTSGAVACIFLVSSRLGCGMSLAEVCATSQEMLMWSFSGGVQDFECSFINFKK